MGQDNNAARRRSAGLLPGDVTHLVEYEITDPLAAIAQKAKQPGVNEIGK